MLVRARMVATKSFPAIAANTLHSLLNEFIEKVVVHEGEGRGNSRRQRIDIYLNFIGAFEVPAHIVTPMEAEEQRRQQEEQAAKEARSQELAKAREEKRKAEKREFTARKKAGLLTPEEQAADEARLAHNRAWQKEWRKKRKAAEPPKSPKPKSLKELAALQKAGADLTPEEAERLAAYRERKNRQHKLFGKGVLLNHSFSTKRCGSIANRFHRMLSGVGPDCGCSRVFSFSHYTTPTKR